MIRNIFILIILTVSFGILYGCNSTGQPIAPPGQNQQQPGTNLPTPPPDPGQTTPGNTDPLQVDVFRSADSGKVPFQVSFTSVVTGGVEPYQYAWDFDSNGITDAIEANTTPYYAAPGIYYVKLVVQDSAGAQAVETFEVEALEPTPNPVINALPSQGGAPLDVNFIAEDSTPQVGASIVEYRWDFEPDGIWDVITSENNGNVSFTYNNPGNYYPVLRIYDNLGYWEEASFQIIVGF